MTSQTGHQGGQGVALKMTSLTGHFQSFFNISRKNSKTSTVNQQSVFTL